MGKQSSYPRRFAEEALGHNSKAVHHAYASKAEVKVPSLETWEKQMHEGKIVDINFAKSASNIRGGSQQGEDSTGPVAVNKS